MSVMSVILWTQTLTYWNTSWFIEIARARVNVWGSVQGITDFIDRASCSPRIRGYSPSRRRGAQATSAQRRRGASLASGHEGFGFLWGQPGADRTGELATLLTPGHLFAGDAWNSVGLVHGSPSSATSLRAASIASAGDRFAFA